MPWYWHLLLDNSLGVLDIIENPALTHTSGPGFYQSGSRCTVSGENAGRQMATYSAPPGSGLL